MPASLCFLVDGSHNAGANTWGTFDDYTERFDTDGYHDPSTDSSRITIQEDGNYFIQLYVSDYPGGAFDAAGRILVNGDVVAEAGFEDSDGGSSGIIFHTMQLQSGDYVESQGFTGSQTSMGNAMMVVRLPSDDIYIGEYTSSFTATPGVEYPIPTTEVTDPSGWHNDSSQPEVVTVDRDGTYLIAGCFEMPDGSRAESAYIYVNNALLIEHKHGGGSSPGWPGRAHVYAIVDLDAGDEIELRGYQNSAGDVSFDGGNLLVVRVTHGVGVYNSTSQSAPNPGEATQTFDSEWGDPDGYHSTSSNTARLTVPASYGGTYLVFGGSTLAACIETAKGRIDLNGAYHQVLGNSANDSWAGIVWAMDLDGGDYVTYLMGTDGGGQYSDFSNFGMIRLDDFQYEPCEEGTPYAFYGFWGGSDHPVTTSYVTQTYDTVYTDTHGFNAAADGTLVIPATGFYMVTTSIGAAGGCDAAVYINGSLWDEESGGGYPEYAFSSPIFVGCLEADDVVTARIKAGGSKADSEGWVSIMRIPLPFVYALQAADIGSGNSISYDEVSDLEGWHDDSVDDTRFTVNEDGNYAIVAKTRTITSPSSINVRVNGVDLPHFSGSSFGNQDMPLCTVLPLEAGDYVEIFNNNNTVIEDGFRTFFLAFRIPDCAGVVSLYDESDPGSDSPLYAAANFDTELIDTDAYHSLTTNTQRITIPDGKEGTYAIWASAQRTSPTAVFFLMLLNQDSVSGGGVVWAGATRETGAAPPGQAFPFMILELEAGDFVTFQHGWFSPESFNLRFGAVRLEDIHYRKQRCPDGAPVTFVPQIWRLR